MLQPFVHIGRSVSPVPSWKSTETMQTRPLSQQFHGSHRSCLRATAESSGTRRRLYASRQHGVQDASDFDNNGQWLDDFKGTIEENLRETNQLRDVSSMRGIMRKGLKDIRKWREEPQPVSSIANAWVFPVLLITYSTLTLAWGTELAGSSAPDWIAPSVGFFIGSLFAFVHRAAYVRAWKMPERPLNVVITGGTRGIGRAMAREFLRAGDNVYIASRSASDVRDTVAELQANCVRPQQIGGTDCDVTGPSSVTRLATRASTSMPGRGIDVWINNAGMSGSFKPFLEADEQQVQQVVKTNLLGALLCTRAALISMHKQGRRGHVFNMDGAGANGVATPNYAAYGATKAGIAHMMESIAAECEANQIDVGVHTMSPGMVLTELLLEGATLQNKQVFNILCEHPEVVAAYLVPRVRTVCARNENMAYIRFLTNLKAVGRFLTAPMRVGRFFDTEGSSTYLPEDERLDAKRTARLLDNARKRGASLQLGYSISLCASLLLLCSDLVPY